MKSKIAIFFFVIILAACSSSPSVTPTVIPTKEPFLNPTNTPLPLPTNTPLPSPTATPIPIGGGKLLVAFYASGSCGACVIVGDFFTGEILHTIHLSTPQMGNLLWSPNGKYILYTDITSRMNVFLFSLETEQSKKLGDFPAKGGTPEFVNSLKYVKWSYDSEYVMFDVHLEDSKLQKSYYASKDGVTSSYESGFTNWFPDNRTMFSIYGGKDSYNVEAKTFEPVSTGILSKFNAVHVLQKFIVLEKEKTKVTAIPFPANWNDPVAWQYDTLNSQVITLAELSKEIKNGKIGSIFIAEQISENKIILIGSITISNQFSYFMKLVDLKNLPAEIKPDDIFQETGDTPLFISPDGNYYLKGFCTFMETCANYNSNWKNGIVRAWGFQVISFDGIEQALPADLSQFKGVTKAYLNVINTSENLLDGVAFYWK